MLRIINYHWLLLLCYKEITALNKNIKFRQQIADLARQVQIGEVFYGSFTVSSDGLIMYNKATVFNSFWWFSMT